jgi:uncharacterized protein YjiS (DUF1127 family)
MEMHSQWSLFEIHGISASEEARLWLLGSKGRFVLLTRLKSWFKAGVQARRAARELASLDDRMLRDIGVSRADIQRVVRR